MFIKDPQFYECNTCMVCDHSGPQNHNFLKQVRCRFLGCFSYFLRKLIMSKQVGTRKDVFFSFLHFIHGFKLLHTQPYKQCFYATALQSLTHGCKALLHDHTWSVESMRLWRKAWLIHFVSVRQFEWQLEPDVDFALCCKAASPRSAVWNHSWVSLCTTSQNNVLHFGNNEPRLKRSPLPKHLF